eukprot:gb/GFBE01041621.1/.p1 GENE.gb/GFBE01041621.1/~~gb/GFBE01041621.1/.p1  ORF type:complete len:464 (+),score=127.02 gb/GFBE01041621.1/:1-1392(+)
MVKFNVETPATAIAHAAMQSLELLPPAPDALIEETTHMGTLHRAVSSASEFAFQHDPSYTLFRSEDMQAWAIFGSVFIFLILIDNLVLSRKSEQLSLGQACRYVLFWIMCACCFCGWVWRYYGPAEAFMWMSGYMLEWLLSFDNLFVFHLIFSVYSTPDNLRQRPLFIGICGAVVLRLGFLFIGEYLMHTMVFFHLVFGAFLIYTGIKTVVADDDDEDPSQNAVVKWLQAKTPFICVYDKGGSFFVKVPVTQGGDLAMSCEDKELMMKPRKTGLSQDVSYAAMDFDEVAAKAEKHGFGSAQQPLKWQMRATMLFLVLVCIEVSDIVFAVDSVSAIVAQVPNLFLAFTSAIFAMLGLRATFFIIDVLVHMFSLLKYGVAAVLVFIGIKLCLSHIYPIHPAIVCCVLLSCISCSIVASVVQEQFQMKAEGNDFEDVEHRVEKAKAKSHSPNSSPPGTERQPAVVA